MVLPIHLKLAQSGNYANTYYSRRRCRAVDGWITNEVPVLQKHHAESGIQLLPDADGTSDATADANAEKDPASAVPAGASSRRVTNLSLASTGGKEPEQPQQQREQVFSYPVYGWKLIQHPVSAKQLEDARVASGGAPAADAQAAEAEQTMQDLLQAIGDDDDALNLDEEGSVPRDWQMVDKFRDEGPLQEREYPISEFAPGEDPFFGSAISHVTPRPGADGGPPSVMDKLNAELGVSEK